MRGLLFLVLMGSVLGCNSALGALFQRSSTAIFKIVDFSGRPVSNAVVNVNTLEKWIPGEGFGRNIYMEVCGNTDTNGEVGITFPCRSMNFSFVVKAVGYYGDCGDVGFARSGSGFTLRQTQFETNLVVRLKPIVNPIPMYVCYRPEGIGRQLKYPGRASSGIWGFDLRAGDWVKPNGRGEVIDFYVEYSENHFKLDKALDCALVFTNAVDDGCYVAKCTGTSLCSDYRASESAKYIKRLDFGSWGKKYKGKYASELLDPDEYLVIRTRTKRDESGRIVSANYAKIYGPINFCFGMNFISYFNPNENDPNLEADTKKNLMPGGAKFFAP